jgi:hypothetical protein
MVTVEGTETTPEPQPRVFKGREEFESNVLHTVVALGIWLGIIHFNVALLLFSLYFLPLSKSLLFVFWPFPFPFFFSLSLYYYSFSSILTLLVFNQGFRIACVIYGHSR